MKILIYGGSFDPVHKGHRALLKAALAQIKPDYTHIFTARQSPFKNKSATPFAVRQNMAKAAFGPLSAKIIFDDFENKAGRMVYTWETIKYIRAKYPCAKIYLLTGADCLNEIHTWKNAPYILTHAIVAAGERKGFKFAAKGFDYMLIKGSFPDISSSQIRMHKWLQTNLTPKRYEHTKCVARAAVELALHYKADTQSAATAALLHDMAKCMSTEQLVSYVLKNKLKIKDFKDIRKYAPYLLHSFVSAHMAQKIFGIKDKDILLAVERHTLGAPDMSVLQKILYTADMCGKDRRPAEAKFVKEATKKSLDEGLLAAMTVKLIFTIQTRKWLAPEAIKLWNKLILKQNY